MTKSVREKIPRDVLKRLYIEEKRPVKDIAALLGVGITTVGRYANQYGLKIRAPAEVYALRSARQATEGLPSMLTEQNLHKWYIDEELSLGQIAEQIGCANTTVKYWMIKHGIPRRGHAEAARVRCQRYGRKDSYLRGPASPFWRGGTTKSRDYVLETCKGHPRASKRDSYVLQHILVWERANGKSLPEGWVIHHINGVKDDNRIENLQAMPTRSHAKYATLLENRIGELEQRIHELEAA